MTMSSSPLFISGNGPTIGLGITVRQELEAPPREEGGPSLPRNRMGCVWSGHEAGVSVICPNKLFKPLLAGLIQSLKNWNENLSRKKNKYIENLPTLLSYLPVKLSLRYSKNVAAESCQFAYIFPLT